MKANSNLFSLLELYCLCATGNYWVSYLSRSTVYLMDRFDGQNQRESSGKGWGGKFRDVQWVRQLLHHVILSNNKQILLQKIHIFKKKLSQLPCSWINSVKLMQLLNQVTLGFFKYSWRLCVVQHQCLWSEWWWMGFYVLLERGLEERFEFLWFYSWSFW